MDVAFRSVGVSSPSAATAVKSSSAEDLAVIQSKIRHTPTWAQTLAALCYVWTFGLEIYSWLFAIWLCTLLPPLWLALAGYTAWMLTWGAEAPRRGTYPTPLKRWGLWRLLAGYFPAHLHKTADLPPGKPYIFCVHPHGIVSFSAWLTFASEALGFSQLFPGIDVRTLTLTVNFRNPFFREYLLLHGVCDVSKRACLNLLGAGKSIMIAVGGGTESLFAKPGANDLVLKRRKGFVKIALRTGAALVPVYSWGENATFRTANELPAGSRLRRFQRRMTQLTGFTIPLYWGRLGLLPYPVPLEIVVGEPLEVPKYQGDEASAEFAALVDKYHAAYVAALRVLFEAHRERFGKGEADLQLVE